MIRTNFDARIQKSEKDAYNLISYFFKNETPKKNNIDDFIYDARMLAKDLEVAVKRLRDDADMWDKYRKEHF